MEGGSQELTIEPQSPISNGRNGLSGDGTVHVGVNGYSMEDKDSPSNWPATGSAQRSSSGSSSANSNSPVASDMFAEDGNMVINKNGPTTGKPSTIPRVNVPEKIIICLDLSTDPKPTNFKIGDGTKYSPLAMMKRIVHLFVYGKQLLNPNHEYALLVLHNDNATWLQNFTNDPQSITSILHNISDSPQGETFDLTVLFDTIQKNGILPQVEDPNKIAPPYVVRAVLLYARSNCLPSFSTGYESFEALTLSPYFFLDLLYIHEPVTDSNKDRCEEIFRRLCGQLCIGTSYVFNIARNPTKLHDCMSKLLAHSLQRPAQEEADYKLLPEGM